MSKSHESLVKQNWKRWPIALQEQIERGEFVSKDPKMLYQFIKNIAQSAYNAGKKFHPKKEEVGEE